MRISYGTDSIAYLCRARARLNEGTQEALLYAAYELRCGTEARLQEYLDARKDIARKKKKGWQIIDSARELDRAIRLGDRIAEAAILDAHGVTVFAAFYTPVSARLRETAGARLHTLLHAMKASFVDEDRWWSDTRTFLEQIYSDLELANKGTLLGPMMRAPDGKTVDMMLSIRYDSPNFNKVSQFAQVGVVATIRVAYHDSLPEYATPFLNRTDA
jgi:hypothetical protein